MNSNCFAYKADPPVEISPDGWRASHPNVCRFSMEHEPPRPYSLYNQLVMELKLGAPFIFIARVLGFNKNVLLSSIIILVTVPWLWILYGWKLTITVIGICLTVVMIKYLKIVRSVAQDIRHSIVTRGTIRHLPPFPEHNQFVETHAKLESGEEILVFATPSDDLRTVMEDNNHLEVMITVSTTGGTSWIIAFRPPAPTEAP